MRVLRIETADETALYREIGNRVRAERESLGFSQVELAEEIGLTRTSVTNIETGRQRPPLSTLYSIANALGVSVFCLLPNNLTQEADCRRDERESESAS